MAFVIVFAAIAILLLAVVISGVKIIRPFERGLVERLGKYHATVEPGLRLIVPFIDRMARVDMRERVVDIPPQEVITSDNVVVSVDAIVYYEATDPQRLVYNVVDFYLAVTKLAQTNLRNVVGDMQLDEALTSRDTINTQLRDILDDATDKWGTKVVRVEIQRIDPPADVMHAMHEQMKAERTRRATVTTAQGDREAAIARAEGAKQSRILEAEGHRQSQILDAQGKAEATRAQAEAEQFRQAAVAAGEAEAIRSVFDAINQGGATEQVLAIKYLEALAKVADGQATKVFLPLEATSMLGALGGLKEIFTTSEGEPLPVMPNGAKAVAAAKTPRGSSA
jgi:regulator of protease activity HflC (stomatin/prohibitin superfamily)